tara:strand:+ start:2643 stop:3545 length:903 start_codon:yes stop_codon:yes gene_type:complete
VSFEAAAVAEIQARVNARLAKIAPAEQDEVRDLALAMRQGLLAPGKRARALTVIMASTALGGAEDDAMTAACAIELVHTASLLLDDLPSMDDARMRRGKPATHIVFGEDTAILAAIALLTEAFRIVSEDTRLAPERRTAVVSKIAAASGLAGLAGGQFLDLRAVADAPHQAEHISSLKTGALFAAAAWIGGCTAGASETQLQALHEFGNSAGTAFQIYDDLADVVTPQTTLGKDVDADANKATVVSLAGLAGARALADARFIEAKERLRSAGIAEGSLDRFMDGLRRKLEARLATHPSDE